MINASAFALPLGDESVHTIITSPPYFSLRKYAGLPPLVLGGDPKCEHEWKTGKRGRVGWESTPESQKQFKSAETGFYQSEFGLCRCGAWRGDFGLEPTVELYIEHSMLALKECWRVLRKDGVMFWNISDSYSAASTHKTKVPRGGYNQRARSIKDEMDFDDGNLKPKDLCLIPERFVLAAQAQGWYVRSRIVWAKPNPMPESVIDRPTSSHETIWMLTKSGKYWWDSEVVREPQSPATFERSLYPLGGFQKAETADKTMVNYVNPKTEEATRQRVFDGIGRNLRNVWTFATQPYPEAHFATFPEELPRRCILAACPEKTCGKCGKGWVRILEAEKIPVSHWSEKAGEKRANTPGQETGQTSIFRTHEYNGYKTLGWKPSCSCNSETTGKGVCLDVFGGTMTVPLMAIRANRIGIGIELSKDYLKLGKKRLASVEGQEVLI